MTAADNEGEPITEAGLVALRAEISELETVGRREIAARILTARGHGDLKRERRVSRGQGGSGPPRDSDPPFAAAVAQGRGR